MSNKYEDTKTFIDYLDHKNYWVAVFRPDVNGEVQKSGPLEDNFYKSKKATLAAIQKFDGRGLACLAINEHSFNDKSIQSINRLHSLIIDIDVHKNLKKEYVSLEQHHEEAIKTAHNIKEYLENKGYIISLIIDSGNGAHIYIYIDEKLDDEYIKRKELLFKQYKDKLNIKAHKLEFNKLMGDAWKEQEIYHKINMFEDELKEKFKSDILAVDNITKDINRRMKVPGVINKKDMNQKEDRVSKILFYNKDFQKSAAQNSLKINEYQIVENVKTEIVKTKISTNEDLEYLKKFQKIISSPKSKELKETYQAKNLMDMFSGDRSNAEQSLVNLLVFRGFHTFEGVDLIMQKSEIGKWIESPHQYQQKTFDKAIKLYEEKKLERDSKKNSIVDYFAKYQIYLLMDDPKTKYVIYDRETQTPYIKQGDENLAKLLHIIAVNNDINLSNLSLFYFESKKNPENLLLDFLRDNKVISTINDIGFKPTNELIYSEDGKQFFNTYVPNEYLLLEKGTSEIDYKTECPSIDSLLHNLTGNDEEGKLYLINLLAFMIQNPHIKTGKLICFFGEEAAGKGIFYSQILRVLFGRYANTITGKDLDAPYNGYLSNIIALYINEVHNKKEYENTLKNWITEEELLINNKYGSNGTEKTFFTIFTDVNGNNPIQAGERRGVYFKSKTLGNDLKLAPSIGKDLVEKIPKEINIFAQYLMNYDASYELLNAGYETQAKKDLRDAALSIEDSFIDEMFSYSNFVAFINAVNDYPSMKFSKIDLGGYMKDGFIEVNLLLKLYNAYRKKREYRELSLNKFAWFYDKLGIDRENKEHYTRKYNDYEKNVYWINASLLKKKYDEHNMEY